MKRRDFTLLGGAIVAWPHAARAQQAAMPAIGFLDGRSVDSLTDRLRAYRQGLKDVGYVEGENVTIIYRWAENQVDRLPDLAAELVHRPVAVIVASGGPNVVFAAKAATTTIPILFLTAEDPVRLGLVASLARPGGNLTGINFLNRELVSKQLELLRELVPAATRVAVLVDPTNVSVTEFDLARGRVGCPRHRAKNSGPQSQHQRRDRCGLCGLHFPRERATGRSLCQPRPVLEYPASPIIPSCNATRGAGDIFRARVCRGRRCDELREQHYGCLSADRGVCRPHP